MTPDSADKRFKRDLGACGRPRTSDYDKPRGIGVELSPWAASGRPNWLDTRGHRVGTLQFRLSRGAGRSLPEFTTKVRPITDGDAT